MHPRTVLFFGAAFGLTWLCQLPALLATLGVIAGPAEKYLPLTGLGAFGPLLAAVLVARGEPERGGVRGLFRPLGRWRLHPGWYLVALLGPGALYVVGKAVFVLFGGQHSGPWFCLPVEPERLVAMVVFPLGEEIGWRGYALPRMQEGLGPIRASVVLGVLWALWHLFMFQIVGVSFGGLAASIPMFVAGSVAYTWLYNRTGASLLMVVLAHVGAHLNNTQRNFPTDPIPMAIHTAAFVVLALALIALDPTLGKGERDRLGSQGP